MTETTKRTSAEIQADINRVTTDVERLVNDRKKAIGECDRLEAEKNTHASRMHDLLLADKERRTAESEYRRQLAEFFIQQDFVLTFDEPIASKRVELAALLEEKWRADRLAEIADAERMAEKTVIVAEAEWDQAMGLAGAFVPRLMRGLLEIGRLCDVSDPLRVLTGTAQNVFERSALYSNLQSVDERDLGRLSILRIPGAKSSTEETNGTALTLAEFLRQTCADWVEAARRKVEMPRSDAAMLAELDREWAAQQQRR